MSLRFILFDTMCFEGEDDREQTERDLIWLLESLCQRDQDYLRQRPSTPRLYKSGVIWTKPMQFDGDCEEVSTLKKALGRTARQRDVKRVLDLVQQVLGGERFRDIGRILENGSGDCDNLACWRVAELRQAGIPASPMMTPRADGGITYHAIVRWPPFGDAISGNPYQDSDEDPSLLLGMGQPDKKAQRDEEIRKNLERCDYIRRTRGRGLRNVDYGAVLEDVLGLRRAPEPIEAQIERLFEARR